MEGQSDDAQQTTIGAFGARPLALSRAAGGGDRARGAAAAVRHGRRCCWKRRCARTIERRIAPLLEQMAPGQAELKYVDVRVTRPTALPAGASPGFEEMAPGRGVRRGEGRGRADARREAAAAVPQGPQEPDQEPPRRAWPSRSTSRRRVIPFPTPRPQPTTPPRAAPSAIRRCRRCSSRRRPRRRRRRRRPPPRRRRPTDGRARHSDRGSRSCSASSAS